MKKQLDFFTTTFIAIIDYQKILYQTKRLNLYLGFGKFF